MFDLLSNFYPWIKAFHIMAVMSWMAGLFYLPRLFVYHAEQVGQSGDTHALFQTMEFKLLRVIMNPAMIVTWVLGIGLALTPGVVDWGSLWPWVKLLGVIAMTAFHMWLAGRRKSFAVAGNTLTGRQYRMMNEVPTVLMVVIVLAVVLKF
ncbi:MAG: protoporphyrinogen oxidase HemJ [Nitrospira sp.]|nr:protoporphyrinogen oxidase HemJ [Nitrospira sp.]